jgi:hypothetical protein
MAWIAIRTDLPTDPAVVSIAVDLGITEYEAVGKLVVFWSWADQHTIDGNAGALPKVFFDRLVGSAGFADALCKVGWLMVDGPSIFIPKFTHWNTQTSKRRLLNARRQASFKSSKGNAQGNAPALLKALPTEQNRTEELKTPSVASARDPNRPDRFAPPGIVTGRKGRTDGASQEAKKEKGKDPLRTLAACCGGKLEDLTDDRFVTRCFEEAAGLGIVPDSDGGRQTVFAAAEENLRQAYKKPDTKMGLFFHLLVRDRKGITNASDESAARRIRAMRGEKPARREVVPHEEVLRED